MTNSDNISVIHIQQRIRIKVEIFFDTRKKKQSNRKIGKAREKPFHRQGNTIGQLMHEKMPK